MRNRKETGDCEKDTVGGEVRRSSDKRRDWRRETRERADRRVLLTRDELLQQCCDAEVECEQHEQSVAMAKRGVGAVRQRALPSQVRATAWRALPCM